MVTWASTSYGTSVVEFAFRTKKRDDSKTLLKLMHSSPVKSHCDTCKILGGGAFTMNQIIPKGNLNITKGLEQLKCYTYKGDSGTPPLKPPSKIPARSL